jgi:hypothetical protein
MGASTVAFRDVRRSEDMSVTVDAKAIRSQLRNLGDGMLLVARSKPALSAELVREAAVAAEAEESTPWMGSVMVIPAGVVIGLEGPFEDVSGFVEKLAAELGSRTDAEVTLGAARNQLPPAWLQAGSPGRDSVTTWMVLHPTLSPVNRSWLVDEEVTRRMAAAVAREVDLPDATWVTLQAELGLNYAGVSIRDAAPELVRTNDEVRFDTGQREQELFYGAKFFAPGIVTAWFGRPHDRVKQVVEAGRRLLLTSAETAVYGAVLTGRPGRTPENLPLVGASDFMLWSQYWDRVVPDAYGVQVLGPEHLERAKDLSGWVTTRLGGDRYLVQARDIDFWFEGDAPDPEVQAAARKDFAGIILTAEFMGQNPLSEPTPSRVATATSRGTLAGGRG